MEKKTYSLVVYTGSGLESLTDPDKELVEASVEATKSAYAPYSAFRVGCALRLENGMIVKGSNQENAAYPSGLCAERVAFFSAGSQYPGIRILEAAITTSFPLHEPVAPCGACRQVMAETELRQNAPIRLIMTDPDGDFRIVENVISLLPMYFSGEWLKR
ncbi:MAG: cytidine deaminase [Chitinophagales bacterium]